MDNELYHFQRPSSKGARSREAQFADETGMLLSELAQAKGPWSAAEVVESYCRQLKNILKSGDLQDMIKQILELETILDKVKKNLSQEGAQDLPEMSRTYQKISPLLLRSLALHSDFNELEASEFMKDLMEVLRVSLEEEFLFWKSKREVPITS